MFEFAELMLHFATNFADFSLIEKTINKFEVKIMRIGQSLFLDQCLSRCPPSKSTSDSYLKNVLEGTGRMIRRDP